MTERRVFVVGDVSEDILYWKGSKDQGAKIRMTRCKGGADLLAEMLDKFLGGSYTVTGPKDELLGTSGLKPIETMLDLMQTKSGNNACFRVERLQQMHLDREAKDDNLESMPDRIDMKLLVLDDADKGFKDKEAHKENGFLQNLTTKLHKGVRTDWLLYKMGPSLATGVIWDTFYNDLLNSKTDALEASRLIVVIHADDLRAEGMELSRSLSWEKTTEDFLEHFPLLEQLQSIPKAAHIIVRFGSDGVIYRKGNSKEHSEDSFTLYFDPKSIEGEFVKTCPGRMVGMSTAFTAALGSVLASSSDEGCIKDGIKKGFTAARMLAEKCFQVADPKSILPPGYPDISESTAEKSRLQEISITDSKVKLDPEWTILDKNNQQMQLDRACKIVRNGVKEGLDIIPIAEFGKLITADRKEIEAFRSIASLLQEYWKEKQTKPLSIGIFGQPGSGKSFGIMQVARHVAITAGQQVNEREFNLSQFTDAKDLNAAFHLIRDDTLSGKMPLVIFDEFDTKFQADMLGWLRYFLAPMQDGKFLEQGYMHPLGGAVFFFVGGTSKTYQEFIGPIDLQARDAKQHNSEQQPIERKGETFSNAKGPDFVSRLRGYVNILGPSKVDDEDKTYPVRRAILLRALLVKRMSHLKDNAVLDIDPAVLEALLQIPKYHHGARSLEMILGMSTLAGRKKFERSALPSKNLLDLHVDAEELLGTMKTKSSKQGAVDALAGEDDASAGNKGKGKGKAA